MPDRRAASARSVAIDALVRIEDGAYANLVLPGLLSRSGLSERDRAFATELVYGTTRMRRAVDHALASWVGGRALDPPVRAALRLVAYQLIFAGTPPHAAVGETAGAVPSRARGLVNAVGRRVAEHLPVDWPDEATRLSYPDWIVERLIADLGRDDGIAALAAMNEPASMTLRADGYVQDRASQLVVDYIANVTPGDPPLSRVADLCAAPGGKATGLAAAGAELVVAADVLPARTRLVADNARQLGAATVAPLVADGRRPPLRLASCDRVLVDAPCSGLGVLRRRADARWRIQPADVDDLAHLQRQLLAAAAGLLRPGGVLVYSVCTLTAAETAQIDEWLAASHPSLQPLAPPGAPWRPYGRGARLLPQLTETDGMFVLGLRLAGETHL